MRKKKWTSIELYEFKHSSLGAVAHLLVALQTSSNSWSYNRFPFFSRKNIARVQVEYVPSATLLATNIWIRISNNGKVRTEI